MADTTKMTEMRELGWDDEISREGGEFLLLPEGDYNFVVESYERARHPEAINFLLAIRRFFTFVLPHQKARFIWSITCSCISVRKVS